MRCKECADCELYKRQQKFEEMKRNGELFYIEDKPISKEKVEKYKNSLHNKRNLFCTFDE